jgi:hypothetical protein
MSNQDFMTEAAGVAEMQGLYGPFSFPEKLLQKIWDRREFAGHAAATADGRAVAVLHPGRWNRLSGPDFLGARLRIGDREITGDVEVHLREQDWAAHRHAADPAYGNVVLHVVLFEPSAVWTVGAAGVRIPILALLPLLHHGLEEYAADDAVETLANHPLDRAREVLGLLEPLALRARLRRHAAERWKQKVGFARERIRRLGWEAACHHAALEILGYRFNRAPLLAVATEYPLAAWVSGGADPDRIFESRRERWSLRGVRPANHPRLRLRQYASWVVARPDWPERLQRLGDRLRPALTAAESLGEEANTQAVRKAARLTAFREDCAEELCAGVVGGSRFDNLMCDGFLPLLAAKTGVEPAVLWTHWFTGDAPADLIGILRGLEVFGGTGRPAAHGPIQGLLGWMVTHTA